MQKRYTTNSLCCFYNLVKERNHNYESYQNHINYCIFILSSESVQCHTWEKLESSNQRPNYPPTTSLRSGPWKLLTSIQINSSPLICFRSKYSIRNFGTVEEWTGQRQLGPDIGVLKDIKSSSEKSFYQVNYEKRSHKNLTRLSYTKFMLHVVHVNVGNN